MFCPECGSLTRGSASKSTSNLLNAKKKDKDIREIVHEAKVRFGNKNVRDEISLDQRFEKAKESHGQIRAFCIDKSKKKQIKNSQVNFYVLL
jgi:hypothetical protein